MKITDIDHFVLTTMDVEACLHFYKDTLGMEKRETNGRFSLWFGRHKINIHTRPAEFLPAADKPVPGSLDLCFEIDDPVLKKTKNASGHTTSNTETMSAAAVTQTTTKPISEDSSNNKDVDLDDINVSRVNGDVILTMPSDIISSDEENSFEDILKNPHIKGVTDNGDGTVKVVIPESEYDALMNEIHAQFAESIKEIVQSEEYSTITDIKFNDEFTSFKIYVTDQQSFDDSTDSIVFLSLYLIAGYYAYFDGREVTEEDLEIRLFDANGNEFFEED